MNSRWQQRTGASGRPWPDVAVRIGVHAEEHGYVFLYCLRAASVPRSDRFGEVSGHTFFFENALPCAVPKSVVWRAFSSSLVARAFHLRSFHRPSAAILSEPACGAHTGTPEGGRGPRDRVWQAGSQPYMVARDGPIFGGWPHSRGGFWPWAEAGGRNSRPPRQKRRFPIRTANGGPIGWLGWLGQASRHQPAAGY
jgi:hypothetical protein